MKDSKFWSGGKRTPEYTQSLLNQLTAWRDGTPLHNTFSDECCPDFSCCVGHMLEAEKRVPMAEQMLLEIGGVQ